MKKQRFLRPFLLRYIISFGLWVYAYFFPYRKDKSYEVFKNNLFGANLLFWMLKWTKQKHTETAVRGLWWALSIAYILISNIFCYCKQILMSLSPTLSPSSHGQNTILYLNRDTMFIWTWYLTDLENPCLKWKMFQLMVEEDPKIETNTVFPGSDVNILI